MEDVVRRLTAGLEKGMAYVTALGRRGADDPLDQPVGERSHRVERRPARRSQCDRVGASRRPRGRRPPRSRPSGPIRIPYGSRPGTPRRQPDPVPDRSTAAGDRSTSRPTTRCENPEVRGFVFIMSDTTVQRLMDDIYDSMAAGDAGGDDRCHGGRVAVAADRGFAGDGQPARHGADHGRAPGGGQIGRHRRAATDTVGSRSSTPTSGHRRSGSSCSPTEPPRCSTSP